MRRLQGTTLSYVGYTWKSRTSSYLPMEVCGVDSRI
jgi:hypothetical protein